MRVLGEIKGLSKGAHALSVNQYGDISNGCTSTGPHFNPYGKTHGGPNDDERHVGDLGNIVANDEGTSKFDFNDVLLRLNGPNSIIGRSVVVNNEQDDLGIGYYFKYWRKIAYFIYFIYKIDPMGDL